MSARRLLQLGVGLKGRQTAPGAGLVEQFKYLLLRGLVVGQRHGRAGSGAEENPHPPEENKQALHKQSDTVRTFPFSSPHRKYYNPAILAGGMVWARWY